MDTKVVPFQHRDLFFTLSLGLNLQVLMRETPLKEWLTTKDLAERLSGTLRKSARIGFKHGGMLFHEALCQTLGWGFEGVASSYVTFNDAVIEGDCHSLTEAGWHFDRMLHVWPWPEDKFELKYINIQDTNGNIERQGVRVILRETSVQWIRPGHLVFALLTEYDPKTGVWTECTNPF